MSAYSNDAITLSNGDIAFWIDDDASLHIKCITKTGDPVELNYEEVLELCQLLQQMIERIA